jgi:RNA polymerase sigma-70 factor (ECF subfamily)
MVTAMKSGDQSALAQLYDRYSSIVYAVALRVLGDAGAAEDVLQEVFLQLWRKPQAFDAARGNLGAWLAVITRNRAIDALRRRKPETDIEDVIVSVAPDLAADADRSRAAEKVRGVLGSMPALQRTALEMAYFEGMSHSEIATKDGRAAGDDQDADSRRVDDVEEVVWDVNWDSNRKARQTRDCCVANCATRRAARSDPSADKKRPPQDDNLE